MKTALIYTLLISFTCFTFITSQIVSHSIPNSKEYEKEVLKYWTPERMRNAIPVDFPTTRRFYSIYNVTEYVPAPEYSQMPYKAIGKIYFTRAGMNYVCSGVANGNCTVITAGHCVSDGQGHYHSNWIFKPAYNARDGPAGTWIARKLIAVDTWHFRGDKSRDVGWGIVNMQNGKTLEEATGALDIGTCKLGEGVISVGYPVPQFGGQRMVRTKTNITREDGGVAPRALGIYSPMRNGAFGGPWVNDKMMVCGVNSYVYRGDAYLFSPLFDAVIMDWRERALQE